MSTRIICYDLQTGFFQHSASFFTLWFQWVPLNYRHDFIHQVIGWQLSACRKCFIMKIVGFHSSIRNLIDKTHKRCNFVLCCRYSNSYFSGAIGFIFSSKMSFNNFCFVKKISMCQNLLFHVQWYFLHHFDGKYGRATVLLVKCS